MQPQSSLNIFFDVDYTLLSMDGSLRPGTRETFEKLVSDGHRIFIWSGIGMRTAEIHKHKLQEFVSGIFVKPLEDFDNALPSFGVHVRPDFVIDDFPQIVGNFGGIVVRPYYFRTTEDDEMEHIYRIVTDFANEGHSEHPAFRPGKNGENRG